MDILLFQRLPLELAKKIYSLVDLDSYIVIKISVIETKLSFRFLIEQQ